MWPWSLTSRPQKLTVSCPCSVDLLCQLASTSVPSFSTYRVHKRTYGRTNWRTNKEIKYTSTLLGVGHLSRAAQRPNFKVPLPRSFVPNPQNIQAKFHRRRPSSRGAIGLWKCWTPHGRTEQSHRILTTQAWKQTSGNPSGLTWTWNYRGITLFYNFTTALLYMVSSVTMAKIVAML